MKVVSKKVMFNGWNCVEITDGSVSAVVTTDVGPRILFYGFSGGFNHLAVFENKGKPENKFTHFGGHRLWHAPEHQLRTYEPDNSKVKVELIEDGAVFTQKQESTGIVKKLKVEFIEENKLAVAHKLINNAVFPVKCAVWALSQFATGGMMAVPNSELDTGLVANRVVSLWPYSKMTDERVYWGDRYITVEQKNIEKPFKFGMSCDMEYAGYFNNNELVIKHFPYIRGAEYPNYSSNFESYTNHEFIEIESLSPLDTIEEFGGEMEMEEIWEIFKDVRRPARNDEQAIADVFDKYVEEFNSGCEDGCCCEDGDDCEEGCQHCNH